MPNKINNSKSEAISSALRIGLCGLSCLSIIATIITAALIQKQALTRNSRIFVALGTIILISTIMTLLAPLFFQPKLSIIRESKYDTVDETLLDYLHSKPVVDRINDLALNHINQTQVIKISSRLLPEIQNHPKIKLSKVLTVALLLTISILCEFIVLFSGAFSEKFFPPEMRRNAIFTLVLFFGIIAAVALPIAAFIASNSVENIRFYNGSNLLTITYCDSSSNAKCSIISDGIVFPNNQIPTLIQALEDQKECSIELHNHSIEANNQSSLILHIEDVTKYTEEKRI